MTGSKNSKIILGAASVCAALATVFAYAHLTRSGSREVAGAVPVLVAARPLRPGTILQRDMLRVAEQPATSISRDALRSPNGVIGRVVSRQTEPGEVLTNGSLVEVGAAMAPAYVLPPSMRAVTVHPDASTGMAELIRPGDHVDVLATFTRGQESSAQLVLQDIQVLAVAGRTEIPPPGDTTTKTSRAAAASAGGSAPVTLAVTVPEAERLVLCDSEGKIRLALRPAQGGDYASSTGITLTQVSGLPGPKPPAAAAPAAPVNPAPATVMASASPAPATVRPAAHPIFASVFGSRASLRPAASPAKEPEIHEVTVVRGTKMETVRVEDANASKQKPTGGSEGKEKESGIQSDASERASNGGTIHVTTRPTE